MLEVKKLGNIYGATGGSYAGMVYDDVGISPSIDTMSGGNNQPMIVRMQGRNPDNPSDRTPGVKTEQRLEPNRDGICNTLTSVQKDNLVLEAKALRMVRTEEGKKLRKQYEAHKIKHKFNEFREAEPRFDGCSNTLTTAQKDNLVLIKQATKQGYIECKVGGVADLSYPDSKTRRGRVQDMGDTSPTLTARETDICKIESPYRIRKLTPLECWRLMGFNDNEFRAAESVNSNTQLYKQAGNSIVVDVLASLFNNIFESLEDEEMKKVEEIKTIKFETDKMIDLAALAEKEPELFEELAKDYPCEDATYIYEVKNAI